MTLPADGTSVFTSPLAIGEQYLLVASGTYVYHSNGAIADAEWVFRRTSGAWIEEPPGSDLDILVEGIDVNWEGAVDGTLWATHTFSPDHIYRQTILGTGQPLQLKIYDTEYGDNSGSLDVAILGPLLVGDFDYDGFVGISDLNVILGNWNQNVSVGSRMHGDIAGNGDGFVGIDDLNTLLGNWNAGAPPTSAAIPEPAIATMLLLGSLAMLRRAV